MLTVTVFVIYRGKKNFDDAYKMSTFEDVKNIDFSTKTAVHGYLRIIQMTLPSDNIYYDNIPSLIYYLCVLYYYIKECFDPDHCHHDYKLCNDNTLVTKPMDSDDGVVYLSKIVSAGINRWKFKLNIGNNYGTSMTIGVWKDNRALDNSTLLMYEENKRFYGYQLASLYLTDGDNGRRCEYSPNSDKEFVDGDIIEMILDLNKMELRYMVNEHDYGIAFKDIENTSYRGALSFYDEDHSIEFIEYKYDEC